MSNMKRQFKMHRTKQPINFKKKLFKNGRCDIGGFLESIFLDLLFFKSWHGLDIRVAAVNIKAHLVVNHTILLKLAFFLKGVSNSGLALLC